MNLNQDLQTFFLIYKLLKTIFIKHQFLLIIFPTVFMNELQINEQYCKWIK